jgi:hypothetical protein
MPMGGATFAGAAPSVIGPLDAWTTIGGSSAGTTLTTTILNGSTNTLGIGNTGNWARTGASTIQVAANNASCVPGGTVSINGTTYTTAQTSLSFDLANSVANEYFTLSTPVSTGFTKLAVMFCYKANEGTLTGIKDVLSLVGTSGGLTIAQLGESTNCGGTFGVNLHTINPTGNITACNTSITKGGTFWYVLINDTTGPSCSLRVYDTSFAQVGSTLTATTNCATDVLIGYRIGNAEAGTSTGTANIQNLMARWSGNPPTLHPQNTTQAPVYWGSQAHGFHGSGAVTSIATATTLDEQAGDIVSVACTHETTGAATSVTNTAGETFTKNTGSESNANSQSINVWSTVVASAHSGQTYTCNHPSSAFTNIDVQIIRGATAFDVAAVGNKASGADIASAAFTPTVNATCIASGYIQAGQAMTPGTNYFQLNSSSTNSFAAALRTSVAASSQTATLVHSNTSASMISVNCYKP